ncbi:MAG: ABC transporter ATP-binding protein [Promethearchaeota archaeon]
MIFGNKNVVVAETAPKYGQNSKLTQQLLLTLTVIVGIFVIFDRLGFVQMGFQYNLFGDFFPIIYLFLAFVGVMGVLTNSRIPILIFSLVSFVGLITQGLGLLLIPLEGAELIGSLFFQVLCAGIVVLGFSVSFSSSLISESTDCFQEDSKPCPALEVRDLHKIYDLGEVKIPALRGVNLEIQKGEFVAIMGPSGCGKSTLLNLIGALDKPTAGRIFIDGVDIGDLEDEELAYLRNKKVGFIFQAYNLIARMSVIQNVEIPSFVTTVEPGFRRQRAIDLLTKVGLEDKVYRKPKTLSGGEQQRVAIARALLNSPTILLCDEPTGNLDSKSGAKVMEILTELRRDLGVTIVVVTHDLEIGSQADRIVYLKDGMNAGMKENITIDQM